MEFEVVFLSLDDTLYPYPPRDRAGRAACREARERGYDLDRGAFEGPHRTGRRRVKRDVDGTTAAHERYVYSKRGLRERTDTRQASDALALGDAYWSACLGARDAVDGVGETLVVGDSPRAGVAGGNPVGPTIALVDPDSDAERTRVTDERRLDRRIDESAAVL
ncbi:hypothetical protein BRD13_06325 [Halobacteriales archaeon SW_5_70_135]|nr:MAG: hypothetical protein BRD13_06325 [Halobacteriales archaeon SW_5_70_135]